MVYKGWKKTSENNNSAEFTHKTGAKLTIAKKALSKDHLQKLKELPLHAAEGAVADPNVPRQDEWAKQDLANKNYEQWFNNEVQNEETDEANEKAAQQYQARRDAINQAAIKQTSGKEMANRPNFNAPAPASTMASEAPPMDQQPPDDSEPDAQPSQPAPMIAQGQPANDADPVAAPTQPASDYQKTYDAYNAAHAQEFAIEDAKYAQDLRNGHITPETYGSLFAKKDTVGKIGTLFGLLLSGAGSGLAHQPNMVLQMMNQEIQNDLDAQKQSKANAQNFLRINQANELNKANIGRIGQESKLLKAQTIGANIDNDIKSITKTKSQMMLSVLHDLQLGSDKIPANSPLKPQYLKTLNGVQQGAAAEIAQNNQKASAQLAGISQAQYEAQSNKWRASQMAGLEGGEMMAKDRESKELPGVGYSSIPLNEGDKKTATSISNFQNLLNEYKTLGDKVGWRGNLSALTPSERARATGIRNDLISSYNDVKGLTRFTGNEEELYKNIVPDIGKMNLTGSQKDLLNRLQSSVQEKKNLEYKRMGITPFSDSDQRSKSSEIRYDSQGNAWQLGPNGKPVKVKK